MPNRKLTREQAIDVLMKRYEIGTIFAPKDDAMRAEVRVSCGSLIDEWVALGMLDLVEEPSIDQQVCDVLDAFFVDVKAVSAAYPEMTYRGRLTHSSKMFIQRTLENKGFKIVRQKDYSEETHMAGCVAIHDMAGTWARTNPGAIVQDLAKLGFKIVKA